jgi:hypothetical protein
MSDEGDGPIHQAFWVFPVSVGACYGFLGLLLFAKYVSGGIELGRLPWAITSQVILYVGFLVVFGAFFGFVKSAIVDSKA